MLGWIRAMSRIALINASDRSCPFLGDILPISRNTLCSQFQPFPYRPTPAFLPLVAQTFRIVSVIGEKGEELERKVCLARKLLFSCYRRSIPSKELGVGMYMERKKREKAICFIVEKIILPVDRSNLVDLVTRISRDLKYSFNEISTLLEEDRDNTVILSLFESGIRIASQFSVVNNLLRSKRESVGSRAYPRYRETITYIRNDTDETRMKIRAG